MSQYPVKLRKALRFFNGARNPQISAMLEPFGFTHAILETGAKRLQTAATLRAKAITKTNANPSLSVRLEAFQSLWFPVVRATLNASFPELADAFFQDLVQRRGAEAPLGVTAFLERVRELESTEAPFGTEGQRARALLAERGLSREVMNEGQQLLSEWVAIPESPVLSPAETDELELAIESAWEWYVEWSTIARAVLKRRRDWHALGLSSTKGRTPELAAPSPAGHSEVKALLDAQRPVAAE
jgi:hypothetical protein